MYYGCRGSVHQAPCKIGGRTMKVTKEIIESVESEKEQMVKKIENLECFLSRKQNIENVGNYHATLLFGQRDAMCAYLTFLSLRLADLKMREE